MQKAKIFVTGLGPGGRDKATVAALDSLKAADIIVGYKTYIDLIRDFPEVQDKELRASGMHSEVDRCQEVLDLAKDGKTVTLVSSGDSGVYGMAGILLEIYEKEKQADPAVEEIQVEVVPGVSAANAAASVLGAPLMHDYCVISLSDLMTVWSLIEKRLEAAGQGDFVTVLYNPKSKGRPDYLEKAQKILLKYKKPDTPVGIVRDAGRKGENIILTTLELLAENPVDMRSVVLIGNAGSYITPDMKRMITPRGYKV